MGSKSIRPTLATWPRLLDLHLAATYLSVGESTIRDYCCEGLLHPVKLPGTTLRDHNGRVICHGKNRRIVKILIDREELDRFVGSMKSDE
jgi:hypothetical protein